MTPITPSWDLATVLVILIAIALVIWIYDVIFLLPQRKIAKATLSNNATDAEKQAAEHMPLLVDLSRSLLPVFILVLILRSFLVEPFRIPSGSMMPTLLVGDFILVNKYAYGFRLPVINTKVIEVDTPKRGDVVVFRYPEDPRIPFIKRVIGVPGDEIVYHQLNKTVYINEEIVRQTPVGVYQGVGAGSNMTGAEERIEHLGNVEHNILIDHSRNLPTNYNVLKVPEGHYFVLGDNRDNSRDSRYWGLVPEENLVGKAFFIWMNWDFDNPKGKITWSRIGTTIE